MIAVPLLSGLIAASLVSCRKQERLVLVLDLIMIETGFDTPVEFDDMFAWDGGRNHGVKLFDWPSVSLEILSNVVDEHWSAFFMTFG